MARDSKRWIRWLHHFLSALVLAGTVAFLWHQNKLQPAAIASLDGPWEYCHTPPNFDTAGCHWASTSLPSDLSFDEKARFTGHLSYRRILIAPEACFSGECAFLAGEIGDAAEVWLNGELAGKFGGFPPDARYHKNFPVVAPLPKGAWKPGANELVLRVYSHKLPQTGPRQGPLMIASAVEARTFSYLKVARNVFVPLASAAAVLIVCCLTGLFPLGTIRSLKLMSAFVLFCLISCLFLVSFSEIPRQFLPVVVAVPLHFFLRYGSDWVFFHLLCLFFGFRGAWPRTVDVCYALAVGLEFTLCVAGAVAFASRVQSDSINGILTLTYRSVYVFGFLLLIGPLCGAFGSARLISPWRFTLVAAFLCIAAGQAYDYLVYVGVFQGDYVSKFHHLVIALFFSGLLIRRAAAIQMASLMAEKSSVMRDADISAGKLALQVAHDIRSPLAALTVLRDHLVELPEDSRLLMRAAIERIEDICESLRGRHGNYLEESNDDATSPSGPGCVDLGDALNLLIAERRLAWRGTCGVALTYSASADSYGAFVTAHRQTLVALLSNLLNNAGEACSHTGRVEVSLEARESEILLRIVDNGKGMSEEQLALLGARGYTAGKAGGTGLGVHHAKASLAPWGGRLEFESSLGTGTSATVSLVRATAPAWFTPRIEVVRHGVIAILDDDASIHDVWQKRFEQLRAKVGNVKAEHFRTCGELERYVQNGGLASVHLLDHELIGDKRTGLDLAHELGICDRSILVTSHAAEQQIQTACLEFGMKLLPKALVNLVPITLTRPRRIRREEAEAWI